MLRDFAASQIDQEQALVSSGSAECLTHRPSTPWPGLSRLLVRSGPKFNLLPEGEGESKSVIGSRV